MRVKNSPKKSRNRRKPSVYMSAIAIAGMALTLLAMTTCAPQPKLNLLVVTFDTTRADHLGVYGHSSIETPNIDRLAADGVLFEQTIAAAPITLPSHTTIMTGRYPPGHGVRDNGAFVVPTEETTLAELLLEHGYRTAAAMGSFPLTARFGLNQGFELFDDRVGPPTGGLFTKPLLPKADLFFDERRAAQVNEALLPWIEEHHRQPFFAWIHYFDPHQPQVPPPPYDQLYADKPYDGEIAYADECLGVVLDRLKSLGVADRTVVVFTADHGEGLGEHNEETHSFLVYQPTTRVPLIIHIPGGPRGLVVEERVSSADIMPTVLELLGIEVPPDLHGQSLVPLLKGGALAERAIYTETLAPRINNGWGELRAVIRGGSKYIHGPRPELYDLKADPNEIYNLFETDPRLAAGMRADLETLIADLTSAKGEAQVEVDEETRQRLQALGYLQGSGDDSAIVEGLFEGGIAPQDRVGDVSAFSQAKNALLQGQPLACRELALVLLERDRENPAYLEILAQAELQLGRPKAAIRALERIMNSPIGGANPDRTMLQMGFLLYSSGSIERGLDLVEKSQQEHPSGAGLHLLAMIYTEQGRPEEGRQALVQAIEIEPGYAPARLDQSINLAQAGRFTEAKTEFEDLLRLNPYNAQVLFNYGNFLVNQDQLEAALARFARAAIIEPRYLRAHHAIVAVLHDLGRKADAEAQVERLREIAPASAEYQRSRELVEGMR